MSVSCSRDILFDCIFLHMENGVFSLPVISASILFDFKRFRSSSEIFIKVSSFLLLIKVSLSNINVLASRFKIEKDKSSSSSLILFIPILSAKGA